MHNTVHYCVLFLCCRWGFNWFLHKHSV